MRKRVGRDRIEKQVITIQYKQMQYNAKKNVGINIRTQYHINTRKKRMIIWSGTGGKSRKVLDRDI